MNAEELMREYLSDFKDRFAGKRVQKTPTSLFAFALSKLSGRSPEDAATETASMLEAFSLFCGRNRVVGTWQLAARWLCKYHPERIRSAR